MCLFVDEKRTAYFKRQKNPILCYKIVKVNSLGQYFSPYRESLIFIDTDTFEFSTKSSLNAVKYIKDDISYDKFYEGIHAYTTKRKAISERLDWGCSACIVRCWIHPKDILGVGDSKNKNIVAKRIFFHPDDVEV